MISDDPAELKSEVARAFDAGQYERVVAIGRDLRSGFEQEMEAEDWYRYGQALRKTDHAGEALQVSRQLYRQNSDIPQVRALYAWCVYDVAIRIEQDQIAEREEEFRRAVEAILELTDDRVAHTFSPRTRAVFQLVDYLTETPQDAGEEILSWLHRLHPDDLSDQIGYWRTDEDEVIELPSDREKWYSAYTKALFDLERYQECLDACEEAMRRIPEFSSTNEIWIQRRRALCNGALGFRGTAIEELEDILAVEERWFIYYELARLHYAEGHPEPALGYTAAGALCGDVDPFRWKLFRFMAGLAAKLGNQDVARTHALLALSLREQTDWSMRASQKQLAERFEIDLEQLPRPDRLVDELQPWWKDKKLSVDKLTEANSN